MRTVGRSDASDVAAGVVRGLTGAACASVQRSETQSSEDGSNEARMAYAVNCDVLAAAYDKRYRVHRFDGIQTVPERFIGPPGTGTPPT